MNISERQRGWREDRAGGRRGGGEGTAGLRKDRYQRRGSSERGKGLKERDPPLSSSVSPTLHTDAISLKCKSNHFVFHLTPVLFPSIL